MLKKSWCVVAALSFGLAGCPLEEDLDGGMADAGAGGEGGGGGVGGGAGGADAGAGGAAGGAGGAGGGDGEIVFGEYELTTPSLTVTSTESGLMFDNVSVTYKPIGSPIFSGWVSNPTDTPVCFVKLGDVECTLANGVVAPDCFGGFAEGTFGLVSDTSATGSCVMAGESAPIFGGLRLDDEFEGQRITAIQLAIEGDSEWEGVPGAQVELQGPLVLGDRRAAEGTVVNAGDETAILRAVTIVVMDDAQHILDRTYDRGARDVVLQPGETYDFTTRAMGDNYPVDALHFFVNWALPDAE